MRNVGEAPTPSMNAPCSKLALIMRSEPMANLAEILRHSCEYRGGLEIVFNQQLTRLGYSSLTASLPQAQRCHGICSGGLFIVQ